MNINSSLMDMLSGYNGRVGNIAGIERSLPKFKELAKNGETPEIRARYEEAVKNLEKKLEQTSKEVEEMGKNIGLDEKVIGQTVNIEELIKEKTKGHTYHSGGNLFSYIENPKGELFSTKS